MWVGVGVCGGGGGGRGLEGVGVWIRTGNTLEQL